MSFLFLKYWPGAQMHMNELARGIHVEPYRHGPVSQDDIVTWLPPPSMGWGKLGPPEDPGLHPMGPTPCPKRTKCIISN